MRNDLTIRRADAADIETLTRLRVDFLNELKPIPEDARTDLQESIERFFSAHLGGGRFDAWVAEADGEIVATGMVGYLLHPPRVGNLTGEDALLYGMYTIPKWRRRGVASAILNEILRCVKETGVRSMLLYAMPDGRHLYESMGFEPRPDYMQLSW